VQWRESRFVFTSPHCPASHDRLKDPWGVSRGHRQNATMRLLEACVEANGPTRRVTRAPARCTGTPPVLPRRSRIEPLPRSPYAASKLAGEQYVLAFRSRWTIEGVALRYFNVFGPARVPTPPTRQSSEVLPGRTRRASSVLYGDGHQTRDFTTSQRGRRESARASAPGPRASGWPVNVGAGARTSLLGPDRPDR